MPGELRTGVRGGSVLGEAALTAWEKGVPLPVFDDWPKENQNWAIATRRIENKLKAIEVRIAYERSKR